MLSEVRVDCCFAGSRNNNGLHIWNESTVKSAKFKCISGHSGNVNQSYSSGPDHSRADGQYPSVRQVDFDNANSAWCESFRKEVKAKCVVGRLKINVVKLLRVYGG